MKQSLAALGALFFCVTGSSGAEVPAAAPGPLVAQLFIATTSASLPLGKVVLKVNGLSREKGSYVGDYQVDVSPLFVANEKGRICIKVSEDSLRRLAAGNPVDFTGQAVTSGSGKTRPIDGTAIPSATDRGAVKLSFNADNRRLTFNTTYRFADR